MKERTMNGIPIREVWKMLAAEFPPQDIQRHPSTHKEYVPVEKIEERLNAVVGMENWNFYTDQPQICRLGSDDYESCVVSGRLVLYDDDRVPIVRSTCGASDVIYPKDSKDRLLWQMRLILQYRMYLSAVQSGLGLQRRKMQTM